MINMEVPDDFVNMISEANGIKTEKADEALAKEKEETTETTDKTETEIVTEDVSPAEILAFLKEEYGVTIEDEDAVKTLVEFCNDFSEAYSQRIDEADDDESEIEIDLEAMKTALFEDYDMDVDDVETVRGLVKFAYDFQTAE